MSTKATAAATEAVAKAGPSFRVGQKQVFLPSHVIKMLPPRRIFSPYFATFQVPLRFNKLDLRDYLYHAYGVEVRAVRSWLTPQIPRRRYVEMQDDDNTRDIVAVGKGQWYRPQPIKRMMVELVKPFAFPEPPAVPTKEQLGTEDDPRKDWDYDMNKRLVAQQKAQEDDQQRMMHERKFLLRGEADHVPAFRVGLARQARELVTGERKWRNDVELDERWETVVEEDSKPASSDNKRS
ncbi:mitochondrial ribosomal protein [Sporothrix brasiliensis 5110]|uniref:Large ribosomal subunit protein uL23m n=1 Tax=Sporothrix brasiliensis 5110 TaxID=1398154 RepID=A0A0C2ITI9_9PEZI|nr:mitochondrial ribosomal protein [Sporothrix brasiliensis 5110]KIH90115.1 mitochondrial ribosomal protein [Sporothrix brasiliensis 5110]